MKGLVKCWNGHEFSMDMGPGVRGIMTVCPVCGAGVAGTEDAHRVRLLRVSHALLCRILVDGTRCAQPVANALPKDAEIIATCDAPDRHGELLVKLRSCEWSPVLPGHVVPEIEATVFESGCRAAGV